MNAPFRAAHYDTPHSIDWSIARNVETLRRMAGEGASAPKIAAALGDSLAKNAVIGKAHRLGIKLGGNSANHIPHAGPGRPAAMGGGMPKQTPKTSALTELPVGLPPLNVKPARKANGEEYTKGRCGASGKGAQILAGAVDKIAASFRPPAPRPIAGSRFLTIVELTATTCRWPLGDPQDQAFRYCGADCEVETPYCTAHAQLSHATRAA